MWVKECHEAAIWEWSTQPIYNEIGGLFMIVPATLGRLSIAMCEKTGG